MTLFEPAESSVGQTVPALEFDGLSVSAGAQDPYEVVKDVHLVLASGEVCGLVGESGSGKTTTALATLGYARPGMHLSGSVKVNGMEMVGANASALGAARGSLVSYVPQDPASALNPAIRIGRQLEEGVAWRVRDRRRIDRSRIEEILEQVKLPFTREFLRRYPHQLSGGQMQRVCIAMALLNRPRLIVFDEPTTGLDVTTQKKVLDTIRQMIASEGSAALYVTHDLAVISELADHVGVMYSGMLIEHAPAQSVLYKSAHPYSRRLVMATPSVTMRNELVGIPGVPLSPRSRSDSCPFAPRCELAEPACSAKLPVALPVEPDHWSSCRRFDVLRGRGAASTTTPSAVLDGAERRPPRRPVNNTGADGLLVIKSLDASYGKVSVLHDINLMVEPGQCVALVGESGSGKTTLARCVNGIHAGEANGMLRFADAPLELTANRRSAEARRYIQYIFQNPYSSLNPRLTLSKIIAQPLDTFGLAGRRDQPRLVRELLTRVALPSDYADRYPSQLSGGERQRVAIARALAAEPKLLVCDEITSSLDVSIQASILELLGGLRRETGLTMLFITHHLGLVRAVADQVVILQAGRIVETGETDAILTTPTDAYTHELLDNTPALAAGIGS